MGRPSSYTEEIADLICERVVGGQSIRKICETEGMPNVSTVFRWLADDKKFAERYARAKDVMAEVQAEEIIAIADTPIWVSGEKGDRDNVERSRLQVDARKWVVSRLLPKKYGDRVDLTHKGEAENPLQFVVTHIGQKPPEPRS